MNACMNARLTTWADGGGAGAGRVDRSRGEALRGGRVPVGRRGLPQPLLLPRPHPQPTHTSRLPRKSLVTDLLLTPFLTALHCLVSILTWRAFLIGALPFCCAFFVWNPKLGSVCVNHAARAGLGTVAFEQAPQDAPHIAFRGELELPRGSTPPLRVSLCCY